MFSLIGELLPDGYIEGRSGAGGFFFGWLNGATCRAVGGWYAEGLWGHWGITTSVESIQQVSCIDGEFWDSSEGQQRIHDTYNWSGGPTSTMITNMLISAAGGG
jgi:hypothetical protein